MLNMYKNVFRYVLFNLLASTNYILNKIVSEWFGRNSAHIVYKKNNKNYIKQQRESSNEFCEVQKPV